MRLILITLFIIAMGLLHAQENLKIEGAISIGSSNSESPAAGTMRWQNNRLEVYNGISWIALTRTYEVGSVLDIEDNKYQTVVIGDYEWMVENLRTTRYNDGTPITYLETSKEWDTTDPGYCWPGGNSNYGIDYGALYNWYTIGTGKVCPSGWSLPSDVHWDKLFDEFGGISNVVPKLQSKEWVPAADNESGFSALPAGYRFWGDGIYYDFGSTAWFWSQSNSGSNASQVHFYYSDQAVQRSSIDKRHGFAIRCIK